MPHPNTKISSGPSITLPSTSSSSRAGTSDSVPVTIQSLVRSAEVVSAMDDESLYDICRSAIQHGRPRFHATALASLTRSKSTRGRLSYEELHHLMAATISGVEMCDFIPGCGGDSSSACRSRRAQKVLVNFCPMPRMHYFCNALTLPEVSQNYYDDIYLRPNASLLAPTRPHHHHRHHEDPSTCCRNTSAGMGYRRLSTVKGTETVQAPAGASSSPDAVYEVAPAGSVPSPTEETSTNSPTSPRSAAPASSSGGAGPQ